MFCNYCQCFFKLLVFSAAFTYYDTLYTYHVALFAISSLDRWSPLNGVSLLNIASDVLLREYVFHKPTWPFVHKQW